MRQRRAAQNPTTRLIKRGSGRRRVARSYQRLLRLQCIIQLFAHARSVAATTDSADEKRCSANHLTKVTSSGR